MAAITPSGRPYDTMEPGDIAIVTLDGEWVDGPYAPSSETPMHTAVYRARPAVGAVVHNHALFCTVMAMAVDELPLERFWPRWSALRSHSPCPTVSHSRLLPPFFLIQQLGDLRSDLLHSTSVGIEAGATEVHVRIASPPFKNPCFYTTPGTASSPTAAAR